MSREFGASAERFNATAGERLDTTRVMVDGKTSIIRTLIITAVILGIALLFFTDRYLVSMMVKPLGRIRQQFQQIAQGDLSHPIEDFGRNCVGQLVPLLCAMQDSLREAVSTIRSGSDNIWRGRRKFRPAITISPHVLKSRLRHWKRPLPAWSN